HAQEQPGLPQIAREVHTSEQHFQRVFSRWAGVSPKRFLQYLTKEHVKSVLSRSSVEEAAFATGLSTKSRVYDLMINCEAITPGEYQRQGNALDIRYGFHPTPFGECLIAITTRGICKLAFVAESRDRVAQEFHNEWALASRRQDQQATAPFIAQIFDLAERRKPLHLLLKGTNFQIKVWEALLQLPMGELTTYGRIASQLENPKGTRAVGTAVGKNPVAFLIPCHRVIRQTGEIHRYRWGADRKQAMIGWEQARCNGD
ncbi:MAG: methylated-DNA--[protein]-cysteine S-methyltransferase, partial [Ketobacteraceae bacterium]|nr:methylated-DNA--[protein]-cysteine S-methyltransferase [Ketobacteraceae bacterium]